MKRYIIVRTDSKSIMAPQLAQMARHYKAQIVELSKDKEYQDKEINLNSNLVVYPHLVATLAKARKKSNRDGGISAIYLSNNHNYLEHIPNANRNVRCMVGLAEGPFALIVEVYNDSKFQIRNLTLSLGVINDLGLRFDGKTIKSESPISSIWGDLHNELKDDLTFIKFLKHSLKMGANEVILHDSFDGLSINHHELHKSSYHARREVFNLTLEKEISNLAKTLNFLAEKFKKISVVQSNHDYFIDRFIDAEQTSFLGLSDKIFYHNLKSKVLSNIKTGIIKSTLQSSLEINNKISKKISFMDLIKVEKRAGFTVSLHGDKGTNGAKFNYRSTTEPKSVTGHNHIGGYNNDNYSVGHCSDVSRQSYANGGTSSWTNSLVDIYQNGTAQLITFF